MINAISSVMLSRRCSASGCYCYETTKQLDSEQKHLRVTRCGAFTLIELLVVVLIIGILAAIALPKYELAVEKSRLAEALTMASGLQKAMDVYLLENGFPSDNRYFLGNNEDVNEGLIMDLSNLDCSVDSGTGCASKNFIYGADCSKNGECSVSVQRRSENRWYRFWFRKEGTGTWGGGGECDYESDDSVGEKICKQLNVQYPGEFEPCPDC